MNSPIYILGGAGFVGSALLRACQRAGRDAVGVTRQNYDEFVGTECGVLINANGNSKKFLAREQPELDFELTVESVQRSLFDFRPQTYVYLSSIDVYDDVSDPARNDETAEMDAGELSNYGHHKLLAETLVEGDVDEWLILRMGGFVGTGLKKNSVFDMLHNRPLWVDAASRYQFLDVDALGDILFTLLEGGHLNERYNVCGDGTMSLEEIGLGIDGWEPTYTIESPLVEHYEVSIEKLKQVCDVPRTDESVWRYLAAQV